MAVLGMRACGSVERAAWRGRNPSFSLAPVEDQGSAIPAAAPGANLIPWAAPPPRSLPTASLSSSPPKAVHHLLDRLRPQLVRRVACYQRRTGFGSGFDAEDVVTDCLGALWLELRALDRPDRQWPRALRRVLYREWEVGGRRRGERLREDLPAPPGAGHAEVPEWVAPWLAPLLEGAAPRGALAPTAARLGISRRQLRLRLTALARALTAGTFFPDLKRRAARLFARATADGTDAGVRAEAQELLRLLAMVEPPSGMAEVVRGLRSLAGRRAPARPGSRGCASGCKAPRATAPE